MRTTVTALLMFTLGGLSTTAQQFRIVPQTGIDKIRTSISQNDSKFTSLKNCATSSFGVRMEYSFRKNHGPYLELLSNRSVVGVGFTSRESGVQQEDIIRGNKRYSIGGGYQLSSKAIRLSKAKSVKSQSKEIPGTSYRGKCIGYTSRCGDKKEIKSMKSPKNGWTVRIQPAVGAAYIPGGEKDVVHQDAAFRYNAGNTNLALVSRMGFEFAKNRQSVITLAFNYQKGVGNLDETSISSNTGTKTTVTKLNSKTSSWGLTAGIPITLYKKKPQVTKYMIKIPEAKSQTPAKTPQYKKSCGQKTKSI